MDAVRSLHYTYDLETRSVPPATSSCTPSGASVTGRRETRAGGSYARRARGEAGLRNVRRGCARGARNASPLLALHGCFFSLERAPASRPRRRRRRSSPRADLAEMGQALAAAQPHQSHPVQPRGDSKPRAQPSSARFRATAEAIRFPRFPLPPPQTRARSRPAH